MILHVYIRQLTFVSWLHDFLASFVSKTKLVINGVSSAQVGCPFYQPANAVNILKGTQSTTTKKLKTFTAL